MKLVTSAPIAVFFCTRVFIAFVLGRRYLEFVWSDVAVLGRLS